MMVLATVQLYINGVLNKTNQTIFNNGVNNLTATLATGQYSWYVNCFDNGTFHLSNQSAAQNFTVNLLSPNVTLNAPSPGFSSNVSWLFFNWTANETFGGNLTCNLTVNGTVKALNINSPTNTATGRNITALPDGLEYWNVTCIDPAGNNATSPTNNFTVEEPPSVTLGATPAAGLRTTNTTLTFSYTATDNSGNLSGCSLLINGATVATNATPVQSGTQTNITYGSLTDGLYFWNINCTDPSGNAAVAPSSKNFTIDTQPPLINLTAPTNGQAMNSNNVTLAWTAWDSSPTIVSITCFANVTDNGTLRSSSNITQANNTNFTYTFTNLSSGAHNWSVTCSDDVGNTNTSQNQSFTVNLPDLYIDSSHISVNNTNPDLGQNVTILANVSNIGGSPVTNVLVAFWDGPPGTGIFLGNATGNVAVNGSTIFATNWTVTAGYHALWVVVDPYNAILEMNKSNNNASINFSVLVSTIIYPANGTITNNNTPTITFNLTDFTTNNLTYKIFIDGTYNTQTGNATPGANTSLNVSALVDSIHQVVVQATDSLNRSKNSTALTLIIDTHAPNGTFLTTNGTYYNTSTPVVALIITDNLDPMLNYTLFVNGVANMSGNVSNSTAFNVTLADFVNASYTLVIQSFDDAGNYANSTPLIIYVDTVPPVVTLNAPNNSANFSVRNVTLNYTVTDNLDPLLGCNLTLDGVVVQQANVSNGSSQTYNATGLGEGIHTWNVTCWDGNNNVNQINNVNTSATRNFGVYIAPVITLLSPANNTFSNNATQLFLFNASDETGLSNCSLLLNGALNTTKTGAQLVLNGTNNFTVTGLNNTYTWAVACTDNSSGYASSMSGTMNLTIDLVPPQPVITTPNATWFSTGTPNITFNITDNYASTPNWTFFVDGVANKNGSSPNGTASATALNFLTNGTHTLTLQAVDNAGNAANSSSITIYVDTAAPIVTLLAPGNNTNISASQTTLNFTATDNMAPWLLCNLTLDGVVIGANINLTNNSINSTLVTGLAGGYHNWSATCFDLASNLGASGMWRFYIQLPDLYIDSGNITFSNATPIEGQNLSVNATVFNIGFNAAYNITVQFFLGDPRSGGTLLSAQNITNLTIGSNATLAINYTALIGSNNIYVLVNPPYGTGQFPESNYTNNLAANGFIVGLYAIFSGTTNNMLQVTNANLSPLWTWNITNATGSNILVADIDSSLTFTALQALGSNTSNASHFSDFATLDTQLNSTNLTDSINRTWTSGGTPFATTTLTVFHKTIQNIPIVNSTNTSAFFTGILWDTGDGGSSYNGTQDVAFLTQINMSQHGSRGVYDYEIRVPATLRDYKGSSKAVVFYTELT